MQADHSNVVLFTGSSHPVLAQEIADFLGIRLGKRKLKCFPDGEISLEIEENVRGREVFVIQSVALRPNHYLMELLIMVDALKRASSGSISVVLSYFGYCRQDRKDKGHVPITAKLVANMLVNAGVTRVLTMDLHAGQLEGFFEIPVDNLLARPWLIKAFQELGIEAPVVVTPDLGSVKMGRDYAAHLGVTFAIANKTRVNSRNVEDVILIGDVEGKDVLLADDMCSTGGTLESAAKACRGKGARRIFAAVTHGIFVEDAMRRIEESPIETLFVSNTIPYTDRISGSTKIKRVSVASLFGQAIDCLISRESISTLYDI